jgi:hypothetical protein
MSLGTKWGLFRHYWVVISFVLTTIAAIVLLVETQVIRSLADMATDPTTSPNELRAMPSTLPHSIGGTAVLLVILVLNIYEPQGLTRYGWRRQQRSQLNAPPQRWHRGYLAVPTAGRGHPGGRDGGI